MLIKKQLNDKSSQSSKKYCCALSLLIRVYLYNLFIHRNTLIFPGIYQLSPPQSRSVSVSQPLSSTSLCYHARLPLLLAPSQPPFLFSSTLLHHQHPVPLREPCQSQAYKRGLTWASEDSQLPFCSLAHWRMKLACAGPSMVVGHSRQPGSGAWPELHPLHRNWAPTAPPVFFPSLGFQHHPTHLTSILPLCPSS